MTTNVSNDSQPPDGHSKGLAIGETDVFNCPACARPLSEGTSRCPGCGVHLIMGVRVRQAATILALGIALGLLIGGIGTAAAITLTLKDPVAVVNAAASAAPAAAASASVAPSVVAAPVPAAPAVALSALSGTAVVNGRIAVDAQTLSTTLANRKATTIEIARALRSLAADAALGIDLVARLGTWSDAKQVQADLDDFYRAMADAARSGLRASLTYDAAYRKAGADMAAVLATLGNIDERSRALAGAHDLELPPVAIP